MIAEIGPWQAFLDGLGEVFAWIYDLMPPAGAYGLAIIVLTVLFRILLVPLGVKQIRGMQAMQAIQPKMKAIQQKYKTNKQKQQEEIMKLYKESGVNPFAGCWPVLLQMPIFFALYAVLRPPVLGPGGTPQDVHLPESSAVYHAVVDHAGGTDFAWMNLQCSASQAGSQEQLTDSEGKDVEGAILDCGSSAADRAPYFVMLALMIGTTFYSTRQMQRASPPGAVSQQQKSLMTIMPIMFGVFGFGFPGGLVLYWTTSNLWQIGQQFALLKAGHIGPEAVERTAERARRRAAERGDRQGIVGRLQDRAELERKRREGGTGPSRPKPKPKPGGTGEGSRKKRRKR